MKYSYWYGTDTSQKERIVQHGLTVDSKLTARSDGDLYARGGFAAFRRIDKAIVAANNAAKNNSLPMLVRITMDDNGLLQTGPELSILYFPRRNPDDLMEVLARAVILLRSNSTIPNPLALVDKLPYYENFRQNIVHAYALEGSDALVKHERFALDSYFTSLMFSVVRLLDWEHDVRNRLNSLDPATNWIAMNESKNYIYSFPAEIESRKGGPATLLAHLNSNLAYFNANFGTDICTFPAIVGEPGGNQKSRVDFMFRIDAITENLKAATGNSPAMYVEKYFNTLMFGPVTPDFVKQWTDTVGPYENISWEDNR